MAFCFVEIKIAVGSGPFVKSVVVYNYNYNSICPVYFAAVVSHGEGQFSLWKQIQTKKRGKKQKLEGTSPAEDMTSLRKPNYKNTPRIFDLHIKIASCDET